VLSGRERLSLPAFWSGAEKCQVQRFVQVSRFAAVNPCQ